MVCVNKEPRCECIVRDCSKELVKFEVTLPASTPVHDLITQVAESLNYEPHSFQLTLQSASCEIRPLTEKTQGSLASAGLSTEPGARNSFILEGIGGYSKHLVKTMPPDNGSNASPPFSSDQLPSYPVASSRPATASPAIEYTFSTPVMKHDTGYVGLVNQAMTCYLNSLLQALYMTPEFRNALYKWKCGERKNASKCIPFQLQKLFLNLQTSTKTAVETTELTRSFGWESGEVWQQHDIQELCRVMFDALEQEFKDTEQADLINQLYQGKMTDFVKCLECGTEKSRVDTFLDIPLPVRPYGSTIAYGSIEEALRAFVQPETLEGNNQYKCDECGKKCDAHKGLKFTKFPYLLTLHLKRFDFDYNTLHRIKLNDKVVFPEELDLNGFVDCEKGEGDGIPDANIEDVSIEADSVLDEESNQAAEQQNIEIDQDEDEGIDLSSNSVNNHENEKNKRERRKSGPYCYELYSIMIHSGSATGGHYYAYIKDFSKGEWYCFNDQSVTSITHEDIKKTYGGMGGSRGYYSGAYSSSTNAYMLMYRQINKELNCKAMVEEDFPPHIRELLEELKEAEEREKAMRAKEEEKVKIKVHANHPMLGQPRSSKLCCHNDNTIEEVKALAYSYLKLEDIVPEDRCRLVSYNKSQDEIEESLDQRSKEPLCKVFSNLRYSNCELLLEIRDKDKKFLPYNIGDIRLTVYIYDSDKQTVEGPQEIRTSPCQTLSDLKKLLQDYLPLKTDDIHLILVKSNHLEYMSNDLPLNKLGFSSVSINKVFVCYKGPEGDLSNTFQTSDIYKFLDEVKNVITLQISLPDTKKETLELLLIPPLTPTKEREKPADSTPTGGGLPLTNGLLEEEQGYSSGGAGCTSDQSTSEDSSLTDSDRTIIGEVNECNLASPADCESQFSVFDNQAGAACNPLNGEIDQWEGIVRPVKDYYFMATPYTADCGQKMLRVVVDYAIDITTFKKNLEKYIGVEHTFFKLLRGPEEQELSCSLRACRDHERITIKLERVLMDGEHRIRVILLDLNNSSFPERYICDWIVCNGDSIADIKKEILREVEKRAGIKIPFERCRLRDQNWKKPGAVLHDDHVWDETYHSSQREVYLQELEGPEPVTKPSHTLLFTRWWQPSKSYLGPFEEIVIDSASNISLASKLAEISNIPVEHVMYAKGKSAFPGELSSVSINDLKWETDFDCNYSRVDWDREDGSIIFYRDDREEMKNPTKEDTNSPESTVAANTTVSSYISSYSPKKERALKIYTTPRRSTRSVVDVD